MVRARGGSANTASPGRAASPGGGSDAGGGASDAGCFSRPETPPGSDPTAALLNAGQRDLDILLAGQRESGATANSSLPACLGAGPRAGSPSGPVLASLEETRRHGRLFPGRGRGWPAGTAAEGWHRHPKGRRAAGTRPRPGGRPQDTSGMSCAKEPKFLPRRLPGSRGGGEASAAQLFPGDFATPKNKNKPPLRVRGMLGGGRLGGSGGVRPLSSPR